ncbi:P-type ATPase (P-ATPase) Superfamily, partial [Phytophthora palmivora]
MKSLQEHLVVPIDETADVRAQLVHAPSESIVLQPFVFSFIRLALYCALVVCSCGILLIVSVWFPQVFTRIARKRIPFASVGDADYVLILVHGEGFRARWVECPVHRQSDEHTKVPWVWFEFKKHRYVYNFDRGDFQRYLSTICEDLECIRARTHDGLDEYMVTSKIELFGPNRVLIDKPHVLMLIFVKLVHPFYLFQLFSAGVWFWEEYTVYAIVILVLSATSMTYEIYSEVSNSNRLRSMLVPGDILVVEEGPMCADVLLLSEYKTSFLHAGSTISTVREGDEGCKGVVLSTGFSTGKGELFRSILFPKPIVFEFERDSYRYLAVLWLVAIAAFIKRVSEGSKVGTPFAETVVNSLDLITVAVPPALPLVLSSGIGFAMKRLQEGGIFCIDSQRVNLCGQISCFCFDKTGTLTQEHLSFAGVDVSLFHSAPSRATSTQTIDIPSRFRLGMATCHGLSEHDGNLQGYLLDMAMFEASEFTLRHLHNKTEGNYVAIVITKDDTSKKYGIIKRFPFDATCQRSSAVVEEIATGKRFIFVKGSPEAVSAISTTTPPDLKHKTLSYSADGYYCIGFGVKELNPSISFDFNSREQVENGFEGLALFKNELKPETKNMIEELDIAVIDGGRAALAVPERKA